METPLKSVLLSAREELADPTLTLSVSKIKTFKDCKAKFRYTYLEKLPRKEWDHHVFGKFLHEVLENFYKEIQNGSSQSKNMLLTDCTKRAYANWKTKLNSDQIKESKEILQGFLNRLATTDKRASILGVEKEFYIGIDDKILLNGFIDRIQLDADGIIHVSDYKTTKHKKYLKNDFFQLLTYAFVMCLEDPTIKKIRTSYIMLRHDFEYIIKEYTRDEVMSIEKTFLDYAESIQSERLYRPNPTPLCKFCDHLDICPAGNVFINSNNADHNTKVGVSGW